MLYQNFASPPFGERTLSFFMSYNGQFHQPLLPYFHNYYLHHLPQSSSSSSSFPSRGGYGTFLSLKSRLGLLKKVIIIWGSNDKWYTCSQAQDLNLSDSQQKKNKQENYNQQDQQDNGKESNSLPQRNQQYQFHNNFHPKKMKRNSTEEFLEYFQFNGIEAEFYEIEHVSDVNSIHNIQ